MTRCDNSGIPDVNSTKVLELIQRHPRVHLVLPHGSRHRPGSDPNLWLDAPDIELGGLLELGGALDDLLQPWRIDLQLRHLIDHEGLLDDVERVGQVLWMQPQSSRS